MLHYSMFGKATYDLVALLFLITCVYVCMLCMCILGCNVKSISYYGLEQKCV